MHQGRILIIAGSVLLVAVATACWWWSVPPSPGSATAAPPAFSLMYWHWSRSRQLSPAEVQDLSALPLEAFCEWRGTIELEKGQPKFHLYGGRVQGRDDLPRWVVLRIETACLPLLDGDGAGVMTIILDGLARVSGQRPLAGLQLDWDVPVRRLGSYARFLTALKARLPAGLGLSCTGLPSWLDGRDVGAVAAAVDWWVPQCYGTDPPTDPRHATEMVIACDPAEVTRRCEALGRPFRIGLPAYEQASLWNPQGMLDTASLPIAVEGAFAAGLSMRPLPGAGERLLGAELDQDTFLGGRRVPRGSILIVGEPTVESLGRQIAAVQAAAGTCCRGVSLFRVPTPPDMPCLSIAQVRAAWTLRPDAVQPAAGLIWSWEGGPGAWTLVLGNRSLVDLVAVTPIELRITWTGPPPEVPAPLLALPGRPGELRLVVPFLRAESSLEALTTSGAQPPVCRRSDVP